MCDEIVKSLFSPHFNRHHFILTVIYWDQILTGEEEIPTDITTSSLHFSVDIEQRIDCCCRIEEMLE